MRHLFDAILYVLRTGCAWRHLPLDFPPWGTVHRWFLRLSQAGVFDTSPTRSPGPTASASGARPARPAASSMRRPRARAASG
jgi:transposase